MIFGADKSETEGDQSRLIVDDAYGSSSGVEFRTNNRMEPKSRTAKHDGLFNAQFWQAGQTSWNLFYEIGHPYHLN